MKKSLTLAKNFISWSCGDFSVFPLVTMASARIQSRQTQIRSCLIINNTIDLSDRLEKLVSLK